jgi:hypothetical protein
MSYVPDAPFEELDKLRRQGYAVAAQDGRVEVVHPTLGVMASKPVEMYRRQNLESDLQRNALLFALSRIDDFLWWSNDAT